MKWAMSRIGPTLLIIIGILALCIKTNRNYIFGYRTKRSMASPENWKYANKVMGLAMIAINVALLVPICLLIVFVDNTLAIVGSVLALLTIGLLTVIAITEYKLKKHGSND